MTDRPKHRVSVKIALYDEAQDKVLMTLLPDGRYGLPGGHVEGLEQPDDALIRELKEELGLRVGDYSDVKQHSFWRENNGDRVILGYTGLIRAKENIRPNPLEVSGVAWVSYDDISRGRVVSSTYYQYLMEILPLLLRKNG